MLPQANKWKAQREREEKEIWDTIPEKQVVVVLTCNGEYRPENEVKFINIEEDMQGRDLLTFECPVCKEIHKSFRLG